MKNILSSFPAWHYLTRSAHFPTLWDPMQPVVLKASPTTAWLCAVVVPHWSFRVDCWNGWNACTQSTIGWVHWWLVAKNTSLRCPRAGEDKITPPICSRSIYTKKCTCTATDLLGAPPTYSYISYLVLELSFPFYSNRLIHRISET